MYTDEDIQKIQQMVQTDRKVAIKDEDVPQETVQNQVDVEIQDEVNKGQIISRSDIIYIAQVADSIIDHCKKKNFEQCKECGYSITWKNKDKSIYITDSCHGKHGSTIQVSFPTQSILYSSLHPCTEEIGFLLALYLNTDATKTGTHKWHVHPYDGFNKPNVASFTVPDKAVRVKF